MAMVVFPPVIYYVCSKKCGEIKMTPDAGNFQLICEFCTGVFVELHEFIMHIKLKRCGQINTSALESQSDDVKDKALLQQLSQVEKPPLQQVSANPSTMQQPLEERNERSTENLTESAVTDPLAITSGTIKEEPLEVSEEEEESDDEQNDSEGTTTVQAAPTAMLNTKEKLHTFINAISKLPILWDQTNPEYSNTKLKIRALGNVAHIMNKKFHTTLYGENIDKQVKSFYSYWVKNKRGEGKRSWLSDNLEFFNVNKAPKQLNTKTEINLKSTNAQLIYLIQLFRKFEVLWNCKLSQYLNAFEANAAYTKIARLMTEKFQKYTKEAVMSSLKKLQANYRLFKAGKITTFCYYNHMKFLDNSNNKEMFANAKCQNVTTTIQTKAAVAKEAKPIDAVAKEAKLIDSIAKKAKLIDAVAKEAKLIDAVTKEDKPIEKSNDIIDNDDSSNSSDFKGFPENVNEDANDKTLEKVNTETSCNSFALKDDEIEDDTDRNPTKNIVQSKIFASNKVTLVLIELYRSRTALWDRNDSNFYKPHVRSQEFEDLANDLNSRYGLALSDMDVRKRMTKLRDNYMKFSMRFKFFKQLSFIPLIRTKHKCQYCEQSFSRRQQLYNHEYTHTLKKTFVCDECGKSYKEPAKLKQHKLQHLDKQQYKYLCDECGELFSELFKFKNHRYRKHNAPWPHVCNVCQHGFRTRSRMLLHKRIHTGETPFLCTDCDKSFKSSTSLAHHRQSHSKSQPNVCKICNKAFSERKRLNAHMKTHGNVKEHVCDICNKRFTTRKNLVVHKDLHSYEPKFSCRLCSKRFRQYSACYSHMQKQHRKKSRI